MSTNNGHLSLEFLARSSSLGMVGGVVSQGLKFVVIVFIARHFAPSQFGWFSFAVAVNAVLFILAHFGLPIYGAREIARNGVSSSLLTTIVISRVQLAVLGTAVAVAILMLLPGVTRQERVLVALFGLSNVPLGGFLDWAFQGLHRQDISAILNVLWQLLWLLIIALGIYKAQEIQIVGVSLVLSATIAAIISALWLRSIVRLDTQNWTLSELIHTSWKLLRSGTALGTGTLMITLLVWTDTVIVRVLEGDQAVSYYAAGNRVALAVTMLSNFYFQGAFPLLSHAAGKSIALFGSYFQQVYDDMALIFVPWAVWGVAYARDVIQVIFQRPEYAAGVSVFRLFQLIAVLMVATLLYGTGALLAFHKDRTYQKILTCSVVILLVLCPVLVSGVGIVGAAAATLTAYVFAVTTLGFVSRKLVHPNHLQALMYPCLVGLSAAAFGKVLRFPLILSFALLLIGYLALLIRRWGRVRRAHEACPVEAGVAESEVLQ